MVILICVDDAADEVRPTLRAALQGDTVSIIACPDRLIARVDESLT
jgi:hypothetical protein